MSQPCIAAMDGGGSKTLLVVLPLSGTGSMAWATDGKDTTCRVGGWGSLLDDEGSTFWIGRQSPRGHHSHS